jgi:hypothetical protein
VIVQTKSADLDSLAASIGYSGEVIRATIPAPLPKIAEPVPRSGSKAAVITTSASIGKAANDISPVPVS